MTILNTIHSTGLPQAVSRHVASRLEDSAAVVATALRVQLAATTGSAVAVAAVASAAGLTGEVLGPYVAVAMASVVPHGLMSLHMAWDNGLHEFRRQAFVLILYSVLKAGFVLVLAVLYRGLGALAGYAAASLLAVAFGRHRAPAGRHRADAGALLTFAAPVIALVGLSTTQLHLDLLLVQAFGGGAEETGWYAAAQQVARAPYYGLTGLGMALLPIVARREAEADRSLLANTVRQSIRYALLLLAPAVAVLAVAAPATIELLFTAEYQPGAVPLPWLMAGMAALALFSVLSAVLTGMGRPWLPVAIAAIGLAATTVVAVALIPPLGLAGAALATAVGGAVALVGVLLALTRMIGSLVDPLAVGRIAVAAAVLGAAVAFLQPTGPALVLVVGVGLLLYGAALVLLGELDAEDRRRLGSIMGRTAG